MDVSELCFAQLGQSSCNSLVPGASVHGSQDLGLHVNVSLRRAIGPGAPAVGVGVCRTAHKALMLLLHVVCLALLQILRMFVFLRLPRRALALQVVVPL